MLLKTTEDLNIIDNNIVNKPMIIKHQYTNKFRWYHYLIQIIYCLFSLLLGVGWILVRANDNEFSKKNGKNYSNRHKATIAGICFIIAAIYTRYVMYKMNKYNNIKDHVAIATQNEYGTRYEGLLFVSSMILALIVSVFLLFRDIEWKLAWHKKHKKNDDDETYKTDIPSDILSGVFSAIPLAIYIGMQYMAMKPMDLYYEYYLSSQKAINTTSQTI